MRPHSYIAKTFQKHLNEKHRIIIKYTYCIIETMFFTTTQALYWKTRISWSWCYSRGITICSISRSKRQLSRCRPTTRRRQRQPAPSAVHLLPAIRQYQRQTTQWATLHSQVYSIIITMLFCSQNQHIIFYFSLSFFYIYIYWRNSLVTHVALEREQKGAYIAWPSRKYIVSLLISIPLFVYNRARLAGWWWP